jgi:hypothetical protein
MAAQMQAQQNAKDPVMQAELLDQQVKQGELQRKIAKDQTDAQLKAKELALKEQAQQASRVEAASKLLIAQQQQKDNQKEKGANIAITAAELAMRNKHHKIDKATELSQQKPPKEDKTK